MKRLYGLTAALVIFICGLIYIYNSSIYIEYMLSVDELKSKQLTMPIQYGHILQGSDGVPWRILLCGNKKPTYFVSDSGGGICIFIMFENISKITESSYHAFVIRTQMRISISHMRISNINLEPSSKEGYLFSGKLERLASDGYDFGYAKIEFVQWKNVSLKRVYLFDELIKHNTKYYLSSLYKYFPKFICPKTSTSSDFLRDKEWLLHEENQSVVDR
ncbi:MAG: hypothetical protein R8L53_10120 [Mariprofundales bacterium]